MGSYKPEGGPEGCHESSGNPNRTRIRVPRGLSIPHTQGNAEDNIGGLVGLTSVPGKHRWARERGRRSRDESYRARQCPDVRSKAQGMPLPRPVQGRRPGPSRSLDPAGVGGLSPSGGRGRTIKKDGGVTRVSAAAREFLGAEGEVVAPDVSSHHLRQRHRARRH